LNPPARGLKKTESKGKAGRRQGESIRKKRSKCFFKGENHEFWGATEKDGGGLGVEDAGGAISKS